MKARSRHPLRTEAIALLKRLPLWQRVVLAGSCAVLLLVSAAFLLPSTWLIQRSVLIAAPPARIYSLISDLRWWPRWTIWNRDLDPSLTVAFSTVKQGKGAVMRWWGDRVGDGSFEIVETVPERSLQYLFTLHSENFAFLGSFQLDLHPDGTLVTWQLCGDEGYNPFGRFFALFLEESAGASLETGLHRLQRLCEAR